jgi:hypothetical protein
MQRDFEKARKNAKELEDKAVTALEKVATSCRTRRSEVKKVVERFETLEKQGKIADLGIAMNAMINKTNKALEQTVVSQEYMGSGSFKRDLENFMKDHKFGDLLEGHEHEGFDHGR